VLLLWWHNFSRLDFESEIASVNSLASKEKETLQRGENRDTDVSTLDTDTSDLGSNIGGKQLFTSEGEG
jgi:hypothetical protein